MIIGQLVELATGRIYTLGVEAMTIGRQEDGDVVLPDPRVSRQHAEVTKQGAKWAVRDLGSANGTFVNGQRLEGLHVLAHGDVVTVGQTRFRFEVYAPLAEQDTLVMRVPLRDRPPARPGIPWLAVGVALAALVAVTLVGALVVWPRLGGEGEVATAPERTQDAPAAASATAGDTPVLPEPTNTEVLTVAPPTTEPVAPPPTEAPTDTPVPEPVIGYFRAVKTAIEEGQCTRLEWGGVEQASLITLSDVGPVGMSGKLDICPVADKVFTLEARGAGGTTEASVQIAVRPPVGPLIEYFRVVPSLISPGDCAQLEWGKVELATSAAIEPGIGGTATPGSQEVCPERTTTYIMTAESPSGTLTAETTLIVSEASAPQPVIAFFSADPASIEAGGCTMLTWGKVDYATEVTIDQNIGGVATPNSVEVCLGRSTDFIMTAVGEGGTTVYTLTVAVSPGQLAELADLVIESILFAPNPCYRGQICKVQIKVRNDGLMGAGPFVVRWAPEGQEQVPVEWDVEGMSVGREQTLSYNWIPNRIVDNWRTAARVDVYEEVEEIEEGDRNTVEQYIAVLAP